MAMITTSYRGDMRDNLLKVLAFFVIGAQSWANDYLSKNGTPMRRRQNFKIVKTPKDN
jgi:hypothetical protein